MSYILDALRRSQAERERGQVPGLDARPAAAAALPEATAGLPWRWVALAALFAMAVAVVALALRWGARGTPPVPPAAGEVVVTGPVMLPAAPAAKAAPPAATAAPGPAPLPIVVSAPVLPPAAAATPRTRTPAPAGAPPPAPGPQAASAAQPQLAALPLTATPLAALSPALRRELPPLVLGGSIWSDSALSRFVIVNGQVVREGETAAPGVVLERIGPRAVWLRWRELRLEVPL